MSLSLNEIGSWIQQYGYVIVFLAPMLEILIPWVPGEMTLTAAGYFVARGDLGLVPAVAAAFGGAVVGISTSYGLGRVFGVRLVRRYGHYVALTEAEVERVRRWFNRLGKWTLTIGYFLPSVRHVTAFVAGTAGLEPPVFALFAYPGALIWGLTFILLGDFFGTAFIAIVEKDLIWFGIGTAAALGLLGLYLLIRWRLSRSQRGG